ncbi:MAG TPA: hypothetical protein VEQ38_25425 [Verrucomicrobiae bacterium]|nr:hypothetical protein [Verrucomicrobiae bacterium]
MWLAHFLALFDFTIAQNKKAHAEKTAKRLCPVRRQRCLQNIFIVVLSNHYATLLGRDCSNNFLSMAISAAICPHCIQLSAQRMVIRENRKGPAFCVPHRGSGQGSPSIL